MVVGVPRLQHQVARPLCHTLMFKWHAHIGVSLQAWRGTPRSSSGTPKYWSRVGVPRLRHQVARPCFSSSGKK
ncbi:hypothetical protein AHAS_Ahas18G0168800 [Arachis hypogaea]